ncbi:MAG: phage portal protein [Clostridia bacterium]|nr:phage portal protein [Clostridia bacterium]
MAETLYAFMRENVKAVGEKLIPVSDRFVDEDGNVVNWKIRAITADMNQKIRRSCVKRTGTNKAGQPVERRDDDLYQAKLATACIVEPNLSDTKLLDSWGADCAETLIRQMLLPGEFDGLVMKIIEFCGFKTEEKEIEEVKN